MASSQEIHQNSLLRFVRFLGSPLQVIRNNLLVEIHYLEQFYVRLHNIYAFVSQMFFFVSCALCFGECGTAEKREEYLLMGLKTLLFYSVFTYFATKTRDILSSTHTSLFQNWSVTEGVCRIIIEWAKAIIVVVCLREQGIHFTPSVPYALATFTYYLCTEKIFVEIFCKIFQCFTLDMFDGLEHLYLPLVLNIYAAVLSVLVDLYFLLTKQFLTFTVAFSYFTIYMRLKDSYFNYWKIIKLERETFENFRCASQNELDDFDDVCAVCLNKMSAAKVTPCNHFFHPSCLKQCLKNSLLCPLCKLEF